jgi:hypothetical protein
MLSTKATEIFYVCKRLYALEVEVPSLFSCAGVFPHVRDGHYI